MQVGGALRLAHARMLSIPRMSGLVNMMRLRQSGEARVDDSELLGLGGDTLDLSFLRN